MKALTLWQPWATLIVEGVKPFEFRRHEAPRFVRGQRIAIHAGARKVRPGELSALMESLLEGGGWGTALVVEPALDILKRLIDHPDSIPLSSVLGTAVIGEPVPATEAVRQAYGADFKGDSDRIDHQVYGWPMTEIIRFDVPVPAKGAQGFWNWNDVNQP